jgi:hypothetical protein
MTIANQGKPGKYGTEMHHKLEICIKYRLHGAK